MGDHLIEIPQHRVADFCRRNHVQRLALFGSVLRDDFGPESDVDVLVEFEEGCTSGLRFFAIERELSELLNRRVELHTAGFLRPYFREQVLREARVEYEVTPRAKWTVEHQP